MKKILFILLFIPSMLIAQENNNEKSFLEVLRPYVEKYLEVVDKSVDFAIKETPLVIRQFIYYEAVVAWGLVILALILILPIKKLCVKAYKTDPDWDTPLVAGAYLCYIAPIALFFYNIGTAIMTTWFPKLFLVKRFIEGIS